MTLEGQLQALREEMEAMKARERARSAPRRFSGLTALAAAFLLGMSLTCAGRAYAVAQVPNHFEFTVSVEPDFIGGGPSYSAPWTLPVSNSPVTVNVSCNGSDRHATSFVKITHHTQINTLTWVGIHARKPTEPSTWVAGGNANVDDVKILDCTYATGSGGGDIASNDNAGTLNQLVIRNLEATDGITLTFAIEMIW
jgi:hypothetical protein